MHPRVIRPSMVAVVAAVIAAAVSAPFSPQPVQARDGQTFVDLVNDHRVAAGVSPVRLHSVLDRIAVRRADQLAARRELFHDLDYVEDRLTANGVCWQQLGEIVAYNGRPASERVARFVQQWYTSDGHRAIMLGEGYTHAGGSWTTGSDGYHYAVMIFVKLCGTTATRSATPFTDIADTPNATSIAWVYNHGIMGGCSATLFCPGADLTRGALAQALADGLRLPATPDDFFIDDDNSRFEDGINRLAAAGLTVGCGNEGYCPGRTVRRGAFASALAMALALPRTTRDYFSDDEGSPHEDSINRLAAAGITTGCGDGAYCPTWIVRRGHSAAFLRRAFD